MSLKIALEIDSTDKGISCEKSLDGFVSLVPKEDADVIIVLGGDGFMLQAMHKYTNSGKKLYGMNCGTVGFLMNEFSPEFLQERLSVAKMLVLHPLKMDVIDQSGTIHQGYAYNEVSLLRQTRQTASIGIHVDDKERLSELKCDGVIVATPAGSTAYNLSAHGPIIPIGSDLLALTPISAFRPRQWRGALIPHASEIRFTITDPEKRPVSAVADHTEIRDVKQVDVCEDRSQSITLLYDPDHALEERFIIEQFMN